MKKLFFFLGVALITVFASSCTSTAPLAVTSNSHNNNMKVGISRHTAVFGGLITTGDGGINAAAKNGGITKISAVDVKTTSILGGVISSSYQTIVYGE